MTCFAETPTQAKKDDQGKPKMHLLPYQGLKGAAFAMEFGASKYGKNNYRKGGLDPTRLADAAMRHLCEWSNGTALDKESGLPVLYHAAASVLMLIAVIEAESR